MLTAEEKQFRDDLRNEMEMILERDRVSGIEWQIVEEGATEPELMIRWVNRKHYGTDEPVLRKAYFNMDRKYDGMMVGMPVDVLQRQVESRGWDVLEDAVRTIRDFPLDARRFSGEGEEDREWILDTLGVRLVNMEERKNCLSNAIYKQIGDMALTLYSEFRDDEGKEYACSMMPKDMTKVLKMPEDVMMTNALEQTARNHPVCVVPVDNGIPDYYETAQTIDCYTEPVVDTWNMTLFVKDWNSGSVGLFYPGVMRKVADLLQDSYFVVFSGTPECHIHPAHGEYPNVTKMRELLDMMNERFPEQKLTDCLYYFDRETSEFSVYTEDLARNRMSA